MRLTIALLVLINAYFLNARSVPVVGLVIENPCTQEGLYLLKYYHPYDKDETKYIECNPWNGMEIKTCPEGSKWNSWLSACVIPQVGVNVDMDKNDDMNKKKIFPQENETVSPLDFCSFYGRFSCQNGGICNQFFSESKCFCLSNFTGSYCEIAAASRGAFGQLINETFSLDLYKVQRPLVNDSLSFNTTFDTSLILDVPTKSRVQEYLNLYPNGDMRFDTLINYLVQDFLSQIFPSAFFLREFTLESEIEMGYSNAIPNLLQSAKYGYDKFENYFLIFEEVLDNLVEYLPKYLPKVRQEAQVFFEVYEMIFTRFSSMDKSTANEYGVENRFENRTELTRDEIKLKIFEDFNTTLVYSYDLFRYLNRFDDELSVRGENFTTEEMAWAVGNFSLDAETTRLLSEIHMTSTQMWDSLSFYGFWYVISKYVTIPEIGNRPSRPFFDNKKPVFNALIGDEEGEHELPEEGLEHEEPERLISDSTPFMPLSDKLVLESTTVVPSVARLLSETTALPPSIARFLPDTTVLPSVRRLVVPESTTVMPLVEKMIGETPDVPSWDHLLPELTTVSPLVERLVVESTTVVPLVEKMIGENPIFTLESTTVVPLVEKMIGENPMFPLESTTVVPLVEKMIGENPIVRLDSTTVVPSVEKMIGENPMFPLESTTVVPLVERLVVESTTVLPLVVKMVGEKTAETTPMVHL